MKCFTNPLRIVQLRLIPNPFLIKWSVSITCSLDSFLYRLMFLVWLMCQTMFRPLQTTFHFSAPFCSGELPVETSPTSCSALNSVHRTKHQKFPSFGSCSPIDRQLPAAGLDLYPLDSPLSKVIGLFLLRLLSLFRFYSIILVILPYSES